MNHEILGRYHGQLVCRHCDQTWCCWEAIERDCTDNIHQYLFDPKEAERLKVAFIDLETTSLDADGWGQLLCGGICDYQPTAHGKKPWTNLRVYTLADYKNERWNDKSLAKVLINEIQKYDITVSWNGVRFDEPFLATRLREYGIKSKHWPKHKDLMYTARYKLKMANAKLDNVAEYFNIHDKYGCKKTHLNKKYWRKAIMGHVPSYRYVIKHNEEDIKVLAALWEELKDLIGEIK